MARYEGSGNSNTVRFETPGFAEEISGPLRRVWKLVTQVVDRSKTRRGDQWPATKGLETNSAPTLCHLIAGRGDQWPATKGLETPAFLSSSGCPKKRRSVARYEGSGNTTAGNQYVCTHTRGDQWPATKGLETNEEPTKLARIASEEISGPLRRVWKHLSPARPQPVPKRGDQWPATKGLETGVGVLLATGVGVRRSVARYEGSGNRGAVSVAGGGYARRSVARYEGSGNSRRARWWRSVARFEEISGPLRRVWKQLRMALWF